MWLAWLFLSSKWLFGMRRMPIPHFVFANFNLVFQHENLTNLTTSNGGSLGSWVDEDRSKMRVSMWIARLWDASTSWTHIAATALPSVVATPGRVSAKKCSIHLCVLSDCERRKLYDKERKKERYNVWERKMVIASQPAARKRAVGTHPC